jgi:hypothetical protein
MSHQSDERAIESAQAETSGRVLHMKARHYDLQKAIQQRAQESVEREAAMDEEQRRPKPLKWLVVMAIAAIPALLTLFAVDGFLRAFHGYLDVTVQETEKQQLEAQAAAEAAAAAAEAAAPLQSNEPGVILLQPLKSPESAPAQSAAPQSEQPGSAVAAKK